jgi:hypothetical protein
MRLTRASKAALAIYLALAVAALGVLTLQLVSAAA